MALYSGLAELRLIQKPEELKNKGTQLQVTKPVLRQITNS
jgi:hypothetical protein